MTEVIFDCALEMSLEWGDNFHKPIQERLISANPELSQAVADDLDRIGREVASFAFTEIERAYLKEITDAEATANIVAKYPLINSDNMSSLWAQGQYYAWHDNG